MFRFDVMLAGHVALQVTPHRVGRRRPVLTLFNFASDPDGGVVVCGDLVLV